MAEVHFTIARVVYVKGADGGAEREDVFYPTRYTSLEDALKVVRTLTPTRYIIHDTPRQGMFPAFSGWPDDAEQELARMVRTAA